MCVVWLQCWSAPSHSDVGRTSPLRGQVAHQSACWPQFLNFYGFTLIWACEMAQWVKMLSAKTDTFEFNLWDPHGGKRVSAFMRTHPRAPVWRPEGNLWKLALPFYYVDPGDRTMSSDIAACSVTPWATFLVLEVHLNKWTTWNVAPATERFYENIVTIKMLGFNPRALYRIGKHSTTKRYPQPFSCCTRPNKQTTKSP